MSLPTVLHVEASSRSGSLSTSVGREFTDVWSEGAGRVLRRSLSESPVPHITEPWTEICDNLMAAQITALDRLHEGVRSQAQQEAWQVVAPLLDELRQADVVVLSTPMYNYSIPSALKAWLDQITFPRMNLSPRRFVIIAARGGAYGPGSRKEHVEHQVRYLSDFVQGHFGVASPDTVIVELSNSRVDPLLADAREPHERSVQEARRGARALARELLATARSVA